MSFDAAIYAMLKSKIGSGSGGSSGLPAGSAPHQYLTTDKDGKTVWEEKLCYEVGNEVIIPETHFDDMYNGDGIVIDTKLVEGEEYVVVWNGVEYRCVAVKRSDIDHPTDFTRKVDGVLLGDAHCWTAYSEITDEPFGLVQYADSVGWPEVRVANKEGPQYSCTIFVYKENGHVKKIDPKYLGPNGRAPHQYLTTDKDGKTVWEEKLCYEEAGGFEVIVPETYFENLKSDPCVKFDDDIAEGKEYTVVWNGVEYPCVVETSNGRLAMVNTVAKFALAYEDSEYHWMYIFAEDMDSPTTISIYKGNKTIKKIDPKYLPDSAGAGMMIVTFTPVDEYFQDATADKTVAELFEAYDNGSAIFAMINMGEMGNNILLPLTEIVHPEYMAFDVEKDMPWGGRMAFHAEIFPEGAMVRQKDTSPVTTVYVVTDTSEKGYVYTYDDFDYVVNGYLNGGNMPVALFYRNVNGNAREEIYANMTSLKKDSKNKAIQVTFTAIVDGTTLVTLTYNKDSANPGEIIYEEVDIGGSLPSGIVTAPTPGTAGQFAVSDGAGGITWKTIVQAEEVSY